ncbi:MAG: recombinase family protein [Alphaproteobacteria bacterium]|nr:recombinase family protein [Alphaproteobacteria bacterium]
MKAIILARVSTKEQEDGHSISAQKQRLQDYCERKGLDVIRVFEIIESSTKGKRTDFVAMLDFAKAQKETIAIVADAVDRFQRSFKESVMIDELRQKGQIELHFYRENMIIGQNSSSSDIMRWDFSVMGAKSYVLNLSENVRRSMEYMVRNGEWTSAAPLGYLNIRDQQGKAHIILDPERAFLVRRLFEEYAKGCYSISGDLVRKAKEWDLVNKTKRKTPLSHAQIHLILQNPFYYGEMLVKGKLYNHKYDTLITKELFDKCQQVRLGNTRPQQVRYSEKPFIFRGLLKCAVSGRRVTCDLKKGKHVYLICRDPENPEKKLFIAENEVLDQVRAVFQSFHLPQDLLEALTAHLKSSHESEKDFHKEAIVGLQKEYLQINDRLNTLLDLRLDKSITKDEYDIKAQSMKQRQHEIAVMMGNHEKGDDKFKTTVEALFSLASKAYENFESSKIEQKRQLMAFVFSNLALKGAKLEYSLRTPFQLMVGNHSYKVWSGR